MLTRMVSRICTSKLKMVSNRVKISWKSWLQFRANLVFIVCKGITVSHWKVICSLGRIWFWLLVMESKFHWKSELQLRANLICIVSNRVKVCPGRVNCRLGRRSMEIKVRIAKKTVLSALDAIWCISLSIKIINLLSFCSS